MESLHEIQKSYWKTVYRYTIDTIPTHTFLRKPFLEDYLFDLLQMENDEKIRNKINEMVDEKEMISQEDVVRFLCALYSFSKKEKILIQRYIYDHFQPEMLSITPSFVYDIFIFHTKYFQFYMFLTEVLYKDEQNQFDEDIYSVLENKEKEIKKRLKDFRKRRRYHSYLRYVYLYNTMIELMESFEKIFFLYFIILEYGKIKKENAKNVCLRYIFTPWYEYHKQKEKDRFKMDLLDENIETSQQKKKIDSNPWLKILCMSNFDD